MTSRCDAVARSDERHDEPTMERGMAPNTPGVHILEEQATGPIAGVGTSTAALLGVAGAGVVASPTEITNLTRFAEKFLPDGRLTSDNANLVRGVRGFFENGGTRAYVVRVADGGGEDAWAAALAALVKVDDVSLVCAPGVTDETVQKKVQQHCVELRDRFALLDALPGKEPEEIRTQRGKLETERGYGALYYPWLTIADPEHPGQLLSIPPSGHLAGVFARVDAARGVHKAPANVLVNGVLGVERVVDDGEHGALNDAGVNVLRVFPGRSLPVVWGARTTANPDDTAWRYVNVRRLFLFIEESIQEGIRWAVFEPNDRSLWKRLDRTITEFLTRVWSSGALFGATAAEAFYVKIDDENNEGAPERGQVIVEVGIAPVRPAEFVVVRIGMWAGGSDVQEG
jgi:hypothetical protein